MKSLIGRHLGDGLMPSGQLTITAGIPPMPALSLPKSLLWSAIFLTSLVNSSWCHAQPLPNRKYGQEDKFRQLEEILPTPNGYRTAAGEPGPEYWQQQADYDIDVTLDEQKHRIIGRESITYRNNSPHTLKYLWLQLDANIFHPESDSQRTRPMMLGDRMSMRGLKALLARESFQGGVNISEVSDAKGNPLSHTVVKTMMRIDLPEPLGPGGEMVFRVAWDYAINNSDISNGRTGYEWFEKDSNAIYEIAQWFPRLVAYTDATGWQHKQYLGQGEFTLELGDYLVRITVPADHLVAATGVLQNPEEVLTPLQRQRLAEAKSAAKPVFVVTPEEALENEKEKSSETKTWVFHAKKVRDFAFASSRKYIWDAQGHSVEGNEVMAMSLYPNEAEPLWSKYSTHAIIHTLNVYSRYTFPYPYPVAYSINGPVGGMEYPMICFNGPRPQKDGTYSAGTKYALITVIIHEVGHNYFPMIVNTDERQWTWMDEGINTFLQYLSEQEWEDHYPSQRGEPEDITSYMLSTNQVPIMTNSESVLQFGNNAYGKPATALNILRETILGRELFDFAFKEYARRWKFKRPNPADFFRTMEDASGVDLDWFWAGWFYTTDHVDIALEGVDMFLPDMRSPDEKFQQDKEKKEATPKTLSEERNEGLSKRANEFPELKDFYNTYDPNAVTDEQRDAHEKFLKELSEEERAILDQNHHFYRLRFRNVGGLVMPIIFRAVFEDGSEKTFHYPAEIWRTDAQQASVFFRTTQPVIRFELDPRRETADANRDNNHFPPEIEPSRFRVFQSRNGEGRIPEGENPMQKARRIEEAKAKEAREKEEKEKATEAEAPKQSGTAEPSATPENPSTEKKERKKKKKKTPEKIPG